MMKKKMILKINSNNKEHSIFIKKNSKKLSHSEGIASSKNLKINLKQIEIASSSKNILQYAQSLNYYYQGRMLYQGSLTSLHKNQLTSESTNNFSDTILVSQTIKNINSLRDKLNYYGKSKKINPEYVSQFGKLVNKQFTQFQNTDKGLILDYKRKLHFYMQNKSDSENLNNRFEKEKLLFNSECLEDKDSQDIYNFGKINIKDYDKKRKEIKLQFNKIIEESRQRKFHQKQEKKQQT